MVKMVEISKVPSQDDSLFSPSPSQSTDKPSNISFSTDIAKVYRVRVYIFKLE